MNEFITERGLLYLRAATAYLHVVDAISFLTTAGYDQLAEMRDFPEKMGFGEGTPNRTRLEQDLALIRSDPLAYHLRNEDAPNGQPDESPYGWPFDADDPEKFNARGDDGKFSAALCIAHARRLAGLAHVETVRAQIEQEKSTRG